MALSYSKLENMFLKLMHQNKVAFVQEGKTYYLRYRDAVADNSLKGWAGWTDENREQYKVFVNNFMRAITHPHKFQTYRFHFNFENEFVNNPAPTLNIAAQILACEPTIEEWKTIYRLGFKDSHPPYYSISSKFKKNDTFFIPLDYLLPLFETGCDYSPPNMKRGRVVGAKGSYPTNQIFVGTRRFNSVVINSYFYRDYVQEHGSAEGYVIDLEKQHEILFQAWHTHFMNSKGAETIPLDQLLYTFSSSFQVNLNHENSHYVEKLLAFKYETPPDLSLDNLVIKNSHNMKASANTAFEQKEISTWQDIEAYSPYIADKLKKRDEALFASYLKQIEESGVQLKYPLHRPQREYLFLNLDTFMTHSGMNNYAYWEEQLKRAIPKLRSHANVWRILNPIDYPTLDIAFKTRGEKDTAENNGVTHNETDNTNNNTNNTNNRDNQNSTPAIVQASMAESLDDLKKLKRSPFLLFEFEPNKKVTPAQARAILIDSLRDIFITHELHLLNDAHEQAEYKKEINKIIRFHTLAHTLSEKTENQTPKMKI